MPTIHALAIKAVCCASDNQFSYFYRLIHSRFERMTGLSSHDADRKVGS
jgi:hypothetical protein